MIKEKVYIRTLGCDKNTVDSQVMGASLIHADYKLTAEPADADVIIVNTCCFIEDAKTESIDAIFELIPFRTSGRCRRLIVAGCMAQRYADDLKESLPEVDAFLGVNDLDAVLNLISGDENRATQKAFPKYSEALNGRMVENGARTAYLKIAEGCDMHCTYCAIPSIRGHYRSREPENIIAEAKFLKSRGIEECILIAQDLTRYGKDLEMPLSLAQLLDRLASEVDFTWIRLMYLYPEGVDDALLATMAKHDCICHYLDMPIQHTEDRILKRMGRNIDKKTICDIVRNVRKTLPDAVLRTTIITGFPGETEAEFERMLETLNRLQFDRLGAFAYSREEGTPAATMPDQIDESVKNDRLHRVYLQQQQISVKKNAAKVGQTVKVLIEDKEDGVYLGRTYGDAPDIDCGVLIEASEDGLLSVGTFREIKVTQSSDYDLIGVVL